MDWSLWTHSLVKRSQCILHTELAANINKRFMEHVRVGYLQIRPEHKRIPDSSRSTSSRTNQSSLTCVTGYLSSRIRFSNCGFISEAGVVVWATAAGTLASAGNWTRSGTKTNTNT